MYKTLHKYLIEKIAITDSEFDFIKNAFAPKKLRKRQYLLQEGDICRFMAFVEKGILRMYSIDKKGNEAILQFAPEEWWITDRESLTNKTPSKFNIDALEDSELLLLTEEHLKEVADHIPAFRELSETLYLKNIIANQKRIHSAISQTAEEKYNEFLTTYPQIARRVPQHMIASYLGITPETLSRVRRKL